MKEAFILTKGVSVYMSVCVCVRFTYFIIPLERQ